MLKKQSAFSLIELLVTLTVIGVLIGLVAPSFQAQVLGSRSVAQADGLTEALNLARYEAVRRAKRVTVCASSDSLTSTPTCTGNWEDGMLMFVDQATSDGATAAVLGGTPQIIKVFGKADSHAAIGVTRSSTAISFIRFTSLGTLARISNSSDSIVIESSVGGCVGEKARTLTINLSGLVFATKKNC